MFRTTNKTAIQKCPVLFGPMLVLALCLCNACAGSSSVTDEPAEIPRSDADAVLRTLTCPDNQKPVCNKRMDVVTDCSCRSSVDFRKLHEVNLKTGRAH